MENDDGEGWGSCFLFTACKLFSAILFLNAAGISLYNVMPPEAGIYFNKIQCFCFEEQMLNPSKEEDKEEERNDARLGFVLSFLVFLTGGVLLITSSPSRVYIHLR